MEKRMREAQTSASVLADGRGGARGGVAAGGASSAARIRGAPRLPPNVACRCRRGGQETGRWPQCEAHNPGAVGLARQCQASRRQMDGGYRDRGRVSSRCRSARSTRRCCLRRCRGPALLISRCRRPSACPTSPNRAFSSISTNTPSSYEPADFQKDVLYTIGDYYKGSLYGYETDGDTYLMFYNKPGSTMPMSRRRSLTSTAIP